MKGDEGRTRKGWTDSIWLPEGRGVGVTPDSGQQWMTAAEDREFECLGQWALGTGLQGISGTMKTASVCASSALQ